MNNRNGNFWIGFFLGGLLGGFIIFILGTKEGGKLAKRLVEKVELYEEELEEKLSPETQTRKNQVKEKGEEEQRDIPMTLTPEEMHHRYFRKNGKSLTS